MATTIPRTMDFSTFPDSDGEPVAENRTNLIQMTDLIYAAEHLLAPRVNFAVGGNQFIYYDRRDGRRHIAPDVYIALDVAPGLREKWQTWLEGGKFPDIVFEITSESTEDEDLGDKVTLYARLGADEYYIYDPAHELTPPFRAYHRVGARLVGQQLQPDLAIHSPALGTELRVVGRWLRLIDPATDEPLPVPEEDHLARLAAEEALAAEQAGRLAEREAMARMLAAERAGRLAERAEREAMAKVVAAEQAERVAMAKLLAAERAEREAMAKMLADELAEQEAMAKVAATERLVAERTITAERTGRLETEVALRAALEELARLRGNG